VHSEQKDEGPSGGREEKKRDQREGSRQRGGGWKSTLLAEMPRILHGKARALQFRQQASAKTQKEKGSSVGGRIDQKKKNDRWDDVDQLCSRQPPCSYQAKVMNFGGDRKDGCTEGGDEGGGLRGRGGVQNSRWLTGQAVYWGAITIGRKSGDARKERSKREGAYQVPYKKAYYGTYKSYGGA